MAELYLVAFKGSRKEYFFNTYYHSLREQEPVIIQAERGEDFGHIAKRIEIEMSFDDKQRPRSILRPANQVDLDRKAELIDKESRHRKQVIDVIKQHRLAMKVVDVEWQFDGNKMTVFFTADHRVDFRELVRDLASRYRTRIELRQIGVRDEARRLGGVGICGLNQCCNTFIRDFKPISTQHARDQDLPLNPAKISGNCGRLLCCLRYEADMYEKTKAQFPHPGTFVSTKLGDGVIERIDVFNEQAVIRGEEGVVIRSFAADILDVRSVDRHEVRSAVSELEREGGRAVSADELRRLDDNGEVQ